MKFSFDIRYSLFDILRFKKYTEMQGIVNVQGRPSEWTLIIFNLRSAGTPSRMFLFQTGLSVRPEACLWLVPP